MPKGTEWVQTNVALTPDLRDYIREYAKRNDLSVSQTVRRAIGLLMREDSAENTSAQPPGERAA